ncbi:MAG: MBL fold metallo-hydrolase [Bacilli bacterium]|nr:MBL fold metallo-hydrolase [Bacilli bacterium]
MNIDNIEINTQSSIKITLNKIIYFDPYEIKDDMHDADIIFITHNHYDHMDIASINKIRSENTIIVAPKSMEDVINKMDFKDYVYLNPFEETSIGDILVKTIPAYNINKPFHPRSNNWLGYIITYNGISYYVAGDTDKIEEAENVKCDIAFVPIGGHFTMDAYEASELVKTIKPKVLIPTHYGSILCNIDYYKKLKEFLADTNIEVVEKL